jgi:hypothetical protein
MRVDQQNTIREYVKNLSDEDLRYIGIRLSDRLCGDLADAINALSRSRAMDEVFRSAKGPFDLYDICDYISDVMWHEAEDRGMS